MEVPQYTLRPDTNAMVAPWILKLLLLAAVFYVGIYINVKLLWDRSIPAAINIFIFVFLAVLVATQVVLYRVRFGKYKYKFFTNRIEFEGKKSQTFLFNDFSEAKLKQGLFDKMFNTGDIILSKSFSIDHVPNVVQIKNYLEQLVNYYRAMQQRYRLQQQRMQAGVSAQQPGQAGQAPQSQQPLRQPSQQNSQQPAQSQPSEGGQASAGQPGGAAGQGQYGQGG